MDAFYKGVWPSLDHYRAHVVGAVQIEMHNGRILSNLLTSDLLERYPNTKWVSVESGIGWIPYVLERLDYQLLDNPPREGDAAFNQPSATELFHRQVYACFWFEDSGPRYLLEKIGFDNVLFETDFPHGACLYPNPIQHALDVLAPWGPEVQRKVLQDNAAKLYKLPV
jgi:predicted TIM-barrel fold metal-dependent hydrolase